MEHYFWVEKISRFKLQHLARLDRCDLPVLGGPRGVTLSGGWGNDHCATKPLQISNDTLVDFCAGRENHT